MVLDRPSPRSWRVLMDLAIATCGCFDLSRSHAWRASCEFFELCSFGQTPVDFHLRDRIIVQRQDRSHDFVEGILFNPSSRHQVFVGFCCILLQVAPIFQAFPTHRFRQYVRPLRTLMHCLVDTTKSFVWAMLLLVLMMCLALLKGIWLWFPVSGCVVNFRSSRSCRSSRSSRSGHSSRCSRWSYSYW